MEKLQDTSLNNGDNQPEAPVGDAYEDKGPYIMGIVGIGVTEEVIREEQRALESPEQ